MTVKVLPFEPQLVDTPELPPAMEQAFDELDEAPSDAATRDDSEASREFKLGDHVELGRTLLEEINVSGPPAVHDLGDLHKYDERTGLYVTVDRGHQSRVVQGFSGRLRLSSEGPKPLKIQAGDVAGAIRLAADQAQRRNFFHDAPRGIAFADKFVRVEPHRIFAEEHSAEHRARLGYPFVYDTRAPRRWLQFLDELFRDDADKEERIAFIHEFFGACLLGIAPRFNKALVVLGQGGEGKGSLVKIASAAMPIGSVCSIAPQQLGGEYYRAQLAGKLLNAVSELPEADILQSESFKAIVSGDLIDGRTIRESPFSFHPTAGHAFSANRLPGTTDTTRAFWDRFIVLPFTRRIRGTGDDDPNVVAKILSNELPMIVAALLHAGARMLTSSGFTVPSSHHAALEAWRKSADQVAMFVHECLCTSRDPKPTPSAPHDWTSAQQLYDAYRRWAEAAGHRPPMAINKFTARLVSLEVPHGKTRTGMFYGVRPRAFGDAGDALGDALGPN